MKNNEIIDALGNIDDNIIDEVSKTRVKRKKQKSPWVKIIAVAACICLLVSGVFVGFDFNDKSILNDCQTSSVPNEDSSLLIKPHAKAHAIENAEYPESEKYPLSITDETFGIYGEDLGKWRSDVYEKVNNIKGYERSLDGFFGRTIPVIMKNSNEANVIYSPINFYMALALLSETCDSNTRKQILDVIGVDSIEALREQVSAIFLSSYRDDDASASILSNSIWLREDSDYNNDTLKTLAQKYYASSFSGEMGSEDYNKLLRAWLNEQTKGMLEEYTANEGFDVNTVFGLVSTVYFSAKWENEFCEDQNTDMIFHGTKGDKETTFMNKTDVYGQYFYSDDFSAYKLDFENNMGEIWFILPDEDVKAGDIIGEEAVLDLISGNKLPQSVQIKVNASIPKFDVSSNIKLEDGMKELGMTDVFDQEKSDFSPLFKNDGLFLSGADQAARVTVDEKGCKAAAFTILPMAGAPLPPENEIDFVLDRPFIFVIKAQNSMPLFVGVVNNNID